MAPMVFGENVDPTAAIRAILDSYPFSIGLLRELLQNSDDALASKQVRYYLVYSNAGGLRKKKNTVVDVCLGL